MLKAKLTPVYFGVKIDDEYLIQLENLRRLLHEEADILDPIPITSKIPEEADAVLIPQLTEQAYNSLPYLKRVQLPIVVITSEFGTFSMWDWEIISFLRGEGIEVLAPYSLEHSKVICKALATKRKLSQSKFITYQDKPGEGGKQDSIFRRFYWWQAKCLETMKKKFGVTVEKRSYRELARNAMEIPDSEAVNILRKISLNISNDLSEGALLSAIKLYLALKKDLEKEDSVIGAGINCLNESDYSDTTPCLAWCLLYEEKWLLWACEADIMSLLTMYILYSTLNTPVMMSNIYPFLMGQAAIKHERIPSFPEIVEEPENHILVAHCGYVGLMPQSFATSWIIRPRVLAIVNDNAHAIDARFPLGPITMAKLDPTLNKLTVIEGSNKGYVQYPGSDCRNGMIIKVKNGHEVMKRVPSHHQIFLPGHHLLKIELIGKIMDFEIEVL